jgi:hypothetical protein
MLLPCRAKLMCVAAHGRACTPLHHLALPLLVRSYIVLPPSAPSAHQGFSVSVDFTAASGAFPAGFAPKSGTVTFQRGQTSQSVPFTWACDGADDDDRVVTITLSNPTSPLTVSVTNGAAPLTVRDDDAVRLPVGRDTGVSGKMPAAGCEMGINPPTLQT